MAADKQDFAQNKADALILPIRLNEFFSVVQHYLKAATVVLVSFLWKVYKIQPPKMSLKYRSISVLPGNRDVKKGLIAILDALYFIV